jgi:protein-L-isoaspartate O-methyltransferase
VKRERRASFDRAAELYERARPEYLGELIDDVVALAELQPGSRVVEIGCGTGKATLPLAGRGLRITCVELGASLAAIAQRKLALFPGVQIVNADFETWHPERADYDAVVAFTAFHWLPPELRYPSVAAVLREGGALPVAMVHHVVTEDSDPFFFEVQADYEAVGRGGEPPGPPEEVEDLGAEMEASGLFRVVSERRYEWEMEYTADAYVDVLGTYSNHLMQEEEARERLFDLIRARIGDRTARKSYLATLDVAVRT